jgi:GAF domain-containing protein
MKSQPDAASRMVAEVVTQLPVPSRLGMLRFERLNEASWALLFLDPNCERQFGLPAMELCALVGSPYASLMEPEARYQLHDAIQHQLSEHSHYLVRYTLHTASGSLSLLEMGEAYKQHNRHLLRGYLLVIDGLFEDDPAAGTGSGKPELAPANRPGTQPARPAGTTAAPGTGARPAGPDPAAGPPALQQQQLAAGSRRADHPQRLRYLRNRLRQHVEPGRLDAGADLGLSPHQQGIPAAGAHRRQPFPDYLEALHASRAIDAHNAMRDPRTREMAESLLPRNVNAMLDASIRVDGQVVGVLCLEQTGDPPWQSDEIAFAGELADQFAQVINNHNRRTATSALHLFQRAVEQSANAFLLVNCDGVVEYVNPSFTAITQYSTEEVQGQRLAELPALENLSELLFDAPSAWPRATAGRASSRAGARTSNPTGASCRSPRCTATTAS